MAEIGRKRAEIFLVVEEIMVHSFFILNMIVRRIRNRNQQQQRNKHRIRYVMADRIPKQIEHLQDLTALNDNACLNNLRMDRGTFARLCYILQYVGGLVESRYVSITEKVALFLSVLAHHKKNMIVKFDFKRSGQTVSKHFHSVLNAVLRLHTVLLVTPEPVDDECTHPRWKWFKGCLGALDGTYIRVTVPDVDRARYRTRKGDVCVNVLAVCDCNLRFVYMLTGWEGSAADSRVLRDAVTRPHGLKVPQGQFYLCDNGYTNGEGFLTPYKAVRYHLDDWGEGSSLPQNYQEFFNMNHSRARNVIERAFGLLKKRWAILRSPTFYPIKVQNRMIMACALIHNFIRNEMPIDPLEQSLNENDLIHDVDDGIDFIDQVESSQAWNNWRDNLARTMFDEWRGSRGYV